MTEKLSKWVNGSLNPVLLLMIAAGLAAFFVRYENDISYIKNIDSKYDGKIDTLSVVVTALSKSYVEVKLEQEELKIFIRDEFKEINREFREVWKAQGRSNQKLSLSEYYDILDTIDPQFKRQLNTNYYGDYQQNQ